MFGRFHNGQEMQASKDFKISTREGVAVLEVVEVFPEDRGKYEVIARNEVGEASSRCKVTVNGKSAS